MLVRLQRGVRRAVAVVGLVAGLAHAASVPLTLALPDTEFSPVSAVAGTSMALWAVGTAATGAPARHRAPHREPTPVG